MILTIKAVFLDIDGTLLTDKRSVSQSTIQVINLLKKKGILVGLATGRGPRFVLQYMASLGLDLALGIGGIPQGRIIEVCAKQGSIVNKGDVLAYIERTDLAS
jgi:hydroxymethylpyrimidine pyrophosphatase-like HAD family hydrolase